MKNFNLKTYACLFILVIITTELSAQNKECDYISSRYYHKVAQAELFWMEENYKECYRILSELDSTCALLNSGCIELYHFLELSLQYKNYPKAFESIRSYITNYGVKLKDFKDLPNFREMEKIQNWKNWKKELSHLEKNFVSDTKLYNEIMQMYKDDQYYRENDYQRIKELMKKDPAYSDSLANVSFMRFHKFLDPYKPLLDSIDNINYQKLLHIIDTKGFPFSSSIKYYHDQRSSIFFPLYSMLWHFSSDSAKVNHLKIILPQYIRQGDCPPDMLSSMVDMYQRRNKQPVLYEVPTNCSQGKCTRENIVDYEKLDERRKEIGLPDYEVSRLLDIKRHAIMRVANAANPKNKR